MKSKFLKYLSRNKQLKKNQKKKPEKKQAAPVNQEQEKKPKNKNEGVEMEYKKPDSRRGTDHSGRDTYVPKQGKRQFDRHDGTGRGLRNSKKEGAGKHNWGNEVEEELNNAIGVEEVSQVPVSEQANIEKSEQIGKGVEGEKSEEQTSETKPEAPKEKLLSLEEFRKQQQAARKAFQNKELFVARQERSVDSPADEQVQKITGSVDDDLIKASTTSKNKKKKVQRSQKIVIVKKDVIGFSPNVRRVPRTDRPKVEDSHQNGERREAGRPREVQKGERPHGSRPGPKKINSQDDKLFPVLKH